MIMEVLGKNKLNINLKKCSFLPSNIEFLGFIVGVVGNRSIELTIQTFRERHMPKIMGVLTYIFS